MEEPDILEYSLAIRKPEEAIKTPYLFRSVIDTNR